MNFTIKVHISKCTKCIAKKYFPLYSCFIAFFCSLFNLILKPFPSSMQSTFSKHSSNLSLLSAILNLYSGNWNLFDWQVFSQWITSVRRRTLHKKIPIGDCRRSPPLTPSAATQAIFVQLKVPKPHSHTHRHIYLSNSKFCN